MWTAIVVDTFNLLLFVVLGQWTDESTKLQYYALEGNTAFLALDCCFDTYVKLPDALAKRTSSLSENESNLLHYYALYIN